MLPRYPIYIPTKNRFEKRYTARVLAHDNVPFFLVIEKQEYELYASVYPPEQILVLPFENRGSVVPARNWIKQHAIESGALRHWQLDDNIRTFLRRYQGKRIYCDAGIALAMAEDFVDRYTNIGVAGLNYRMFAPATEKLSPFYLNVHVYSCSLILNSLPYRWRGKYNEDTDYCLQVLAGGYCTVLLNAFLAAKQTTMTQRGGNTDELFGGDGRLKMARELERRWPGVVSVRRRYGRPQHVIKANWHYFDTPLIRKTDKEEENKKDFDIRLVKKAEIKSPALRKIYKDYNGG